MMSIVSNTRVDIVARGVIKACVELGYDPAEKIAIFRIPGAWEEEGFKILERYGVEYADRSVSLQRGRPARGREDPGRRRIEESTEHPDRRRHDLHRPGDHRPRGRQPDARVPGLRRRREDRRRRHPRPPGPRRPRGAGVRHRRAGRRASRRSDRRLGRHRPARVHQGRRVRGARERRQADRDRDRADPARATWRRWSSSPRERDARIIGPNCLGDHRPRRDQDGRDRRPREERGAGLPPGPIGVISRSRRHDDRDVLDAEGRRPRPVDGRLDRRRRDHRLQLRRADAAVRGRRADPGRSSSTPSPEGAWRPSSRAG